MDDLTVDGSIRGGDYEQRGDYHEHLDTSWSYAPIYRQKVKLVDRFVKQLPPDSRLLDVGAGEGRLVKRYREWGYEIIGLDPHYQSEWVEKGSVFALPHEDRSMDAILCLDVLEHLQILEQAPALEEMKRVVRKNGWLLLSLPNLAHLHSRLRFLLRGRLTRTSAVERHPGDRPINEYLELIEKAGWHVLFRRGIFPTIPLIFRLLNRNPARYGWMLPVLDGLIPFPSICFLNLIEARC